CECDRTIDDAGIRREPPWPERAVRQMRQSRCRTVTHPRELLPPCIDDMPVRRMGVRFRQLAWCLLVVALGGCSRSGTADGGPVILIVVDPLRADHVTCYGYQRPPAPGMCQLAESGVRFARAYAPRTNTTPSIATMLTGRYPYRHGIRDLYSLLPDSSVT